MTRKEKAVAVARDIISQLRKRNNKMVPTCGIYFQADFDVPDAGDLREILPEMMKHPCQVCAIGAAVISKARLFDQVPLDNLNMNWSPQRDDLVHALKGVFTENQADLIESAFEVNPMDYQSKARFGAAAFGMKYKDSRKRLIAIMQNIIDNDGTFVVRPITRSDYDAASEAFEEKMRW